MGVFGNGLTNLATSNINAATSLANQRLANKGANQRTFAQLAGDAVKVLNNNRQNSLSREAAEAQQQARFQQEVEMQKVGAQQALDLLRERVNLENLQSNKKSQSEQAALNKEKVSLDGLRAAAENRKKLIEAGAGPDILAAADQDILFRLQANPAFQFQGQQAPPQQQQQLTAESIPGAEIQEIPQTGAGQVVPAGADSARLSAGLVANDPVLPTEVAKSGAAAGSLFDDTVVRSELQSKVADSKADATKQSFGQLFNLNKGQPPVNEDGIFLQSTFKDPTSGEQVTVPVAASASLAQDIRNFSRIKPDKRAELRLEAGVSIQQLAPFVQAAGELEALTLQQPDLKAVKLDADVLNSIGNLSGLDALDELATRIQFEGPNADLANQNLSVLLANLANFARAKGEKGVISDGDIRRYQRIIFQIGKSGEFNVGQLRALQNDVLSGAANAAARTLNTPAANQLIKQANEVRFRDNRAPWNYNDGLGARTGRPRNPESKSQGPSTQVNDILGNALAGGLTGGAIGSAAGFPGIAAGALTGATLGGVMGQRNFLPPLDILKDAIPGVQSDSLQKLLNRNTLNSAQPGAKKKIR